MDSSKNIDFYDQNEVWADYIDLMNELRIKKTLEMIPKFQSILEIGCGNGAILNRISKPNYVVGVDLSRTSLKYVIHMIRGIKRIEFCGEKRGCPPFRKMKQRLFGLYRYKDKCICPNCGSRSIRYTYLHILLDFFEYLLSRFMRKEPNWILCLYEVGNIIQNKNEK